MSTIEVNKDVGLDDVQRALSDALGPAYRVSITSGSSLKVMRNFVTWGTVHVRRSGGRTSFRVRPGGLILAAAFNAVYTTPKIRRALDQAFPQAT
jgi:hypothetical protein